MGNANLPWTRFPRRTGRPPLTPVAATPGPRDPAPPAAAAAAPGGERIVRVRLLPRAEATALSGAWVAGGGGECTAPPPWRAWERRHADTVTGRPRIQRLAVLAGATCTVVHWSVPAPAGRDDEAHWSRLLHERARAAAGASGGGWRA